MSVLATSTITEAYLRLINIWDNSRQPEGRHALDIERKGVLSNGVPKNVGVVGECHIKSSIYSLFWKSKYVSK